MFRHLRHHHAVPSRSPSPPASPRAAAEAGGAEGHEGRFALHIPLLSDAFARLEHPGDVEAPGPSAGAPAATAVLEMPAGSRLGRLFGSPLKNLEATALDTVHRLLAEAERSCAHFTCRWLGAILFAAVGTWAGMSLTVGSASWVNPRGGRHLVVGVPLLVLSLPLPALPLAGAFIGEQAARLACLDLAPAPRGSAPA